MIYREAAKFLDDGAGTLRNRIYSGKGNQKHLKQLYALARETTKHKSALTHIIAASQILKAERRLDNGVALVMTYDLLIGQGRLSCGKCLEKDAILRHKTRLNAELVKYKLRNPSLVDASEADEPPVRWVRVNKGTLPDDSPLACFRRLGLTEVSSWQEVGPKNWYKDTLIPYLYAIHPSISMAKVPEYAAGQIIVQDRASCIPVTILNPRSDGEYMDSCAAPGNKTSQLAALSRHVVAFERDTKRAATLKKMLTTAKLSDKVDIEVMDFTQREPSSSHLDGIIVDPSCSGSGIFRATTATPERLEKLSEFQFQIMQHALRFDADRVVYSTCSIHAEENERVVKRLLEVPDIAERYELAPRSTVLSKWPRRGLEAELGSLAERCIRVEPRTDGGIGFFAACFERKQKN